MKAGENYPSNNAQFLPCYHVITAMDQDNNTRVLQPRFSPDSSNHVITGIRCSLANGLEIAVVVMSQGVGEVEPFTATNSHNALSLQRCTKTI